MTASSMCPPSWKALSHHDVPISVEVISSRLKFLPVDGAAALAARATRRELEKAERLG